MASNDYFVFMCDEGLRQTFFVECHVHSSILQQDKLDNRSTRIERNYLRPTSVDATVRLLSVDNTSAIFKVKS